jgi:hypothetical protein
MISERPLPRAERQDLPRSVPKALDNLSASEAKKQKGKEATDTKPLYVCSRGIMSLGHHSPGLQYFAVGYVIGHYNARSCRARELVPWQLPRVEEDNCGAL